MGWVVWSIMLLGCSNADYGLSHQEQTNAPGYQTIQVMADIALQRHNFGDTIGRCQIQFAFSPVYPNPDTAPEDPPPQPWTVAYPTEPGTCAFSIEPEPVEVIPGSEGDNWEVSGTIVGPEEIYLYSDVVDLKLSAVTLDDQSLRYELPPEDCDDINFPVREVLALEVPEGETASVDNLPGFFIEQALVVGPDVWLMTPYLDPSEGVDHVSHDINTDMVVRWDFSGDSPTIDGQPIDPDVMIKIYNQDLHRENLNEWLVCKPDQDGQMTISADELALLSANTSPEERQWFASVTVHTVTVSPSFDAPWGETVELSSHISEGGTIALYAGDDEQQSE